jgi:RNA polymerase sigma-70 factor (ECF subfamily)
VEQIYAETRSSIGSYLRYLGLREAQTQDVLQELYLRLYQRLLKGTPIENRKAWLFRVAHHEGLNAKKRNKVLEADEPDWDRLIAPSESPERTLLNKEQMEQVKKALRSLSPQQRHCLYLRSEGLRYREIAETLGISVSSVNEFLRRALRRLAEAVDG